MKTITTKEFSELNKFVIDKLRAAAKKAGNKNAEPLLQINFDSEDPSAYNNQYLIMFSFIGGSGFTKKQEKNLIKQLKLDVSNKFKIEVMIQYIDASEQQRVSKPGENSVMPADIPRDIMRQALTTLITTGVLDESQITIDKAKINRFMENLECRDDPVQPNEFNHFFQSLLWPHYDECRKLYPSLNSHPFMSFFSVNEFYEIMTQEIFEKTLRFDDIVKLFKKGQKHYTIGQYTTDPAMLKDYLYSRSDEDFLPSLKKLCRAHEELLTQVNDEISNVADMSASMHVAASLFEKLKALINFLEASDTTRSFSKLIGFFWTARDEEAISKIKSYDQNSTDKDLKRYFVYLNVLKNFMPYAESALVDINARIDEIKSIKIDTLESLKEKRKAFFKAQQELRDQQPDSAPCSDPPVAYLAMERQPQVNVTRESKETAKSLANRKEFKRLAHQDRGLGLFSLSLNESVTEPSLLSLNIINMRSGESAEVDICPSATRTEHAPLFQLLPNVFVLAHHNPCLVLDESLRKMLHANEGRGYIGAVSPGQTGLKYFKNGKEAFVVLKGATEQRVLCAILTLKSVALEATIELVVPTILIHNHTEYEAMLQRPNLAGWLRSLCSDQVLIEETFIFDKDPVLVKTALR